MTIKKEIEINTKICTKCEKEFPATLIFFPKREVSKNGLQYWCRECVKEYNQSEKGKQSREKWGESNPEYMKEYYRKLKKENPEKYGEFLEYGKQWFKNNPNYLRNYYRKLKKENQKKYGKFLEYIKRS